MRTTIKGVDFAVFAGIFFNRNLQEDLALAFSFPAPMILSMKHKNYAFTAVLAVIVLCGLLSRLAAQDEPAAAGEKKKKEGQAY